MIKKYILPRFMTICFVSFMMLWSMNTVSMTRTFAADATTTAPATTAPVTTPGTDSAAKTPEKSALETALNSLQTQRGAANPPSMMNPAASQSNQSITQEQLNQYIATQVKGLSQEKKSTQNWQVYVITSIYLMTLILAWAFMWFTIGAMKIWIRTNIKKK